VGDALGGGQRRVAIAGKFREPPARAETDLQTTTTDVIEGQSPVRQKRGMTKAGAGDDGAEANPARHPSQCGEQRPRFIERLARLTGEVIAEPKAVEPHPLILNPSLT